MCAKPHVPDGTRFTPEEFRSYRDGYSWALVIVMRVLDLADEQHAILERYRRRIAQRKRHATLAARKRA